MSISSIFYMGLGLFLLYGLFTVGFPFLLALLLVVLMEPIVQFLIKKLKISRPISSIIISSLFSLLFFLSFILIIFKATKEAVGLSDFLLKLIKQIAANIEHFTNKTTLLFKSIPLEYQAGITQVLKALVETLQSSLSSLAEYSINMATTIPNFFIQIIFFFIAFYIISFKLPEMKNNFLSIFDRSSHHRVEILMANLYNAVIGFIRAQLIISVLIFIVTTVGFYILGVKYVLATALVVTIVDFLPILGAGSVMVPMAVYNFLTGNPLIGFGLLTLYGILIVFRRITEPKILGDAIGISALSTLISMYLGFKLVGFIGLIMGPTVVILYQALIQEGVIKINIKF